MVLSSFLSFLLQASPYGHLLGKFLRKFATNDKFIKYLIMLCPASFIKHINILYINMKPGTKNSYNSLRNLEI